MCCPIHFSYEVFLKILTNIFEFHKNCSEIHFQNRMRQTK